MNSDKKQTEQLQELQAKVLDYYHMLKEVEPSSIIGPTISKSFKKHFGITEDRVGAIPNESYTPGPWAIHGENASGEILIGKLGEENSTGKIVRVRWDRCGKDSNEWRANAKLIACAPEMLGFLQNLLPNLRGEHNRVQVQILIDKATK